VRCFADARVTDLKKVEESYATQALDLTLGLGYVERLLVNPRISKYLTKHHAELLNEFTKLLGEKAEEMSRTIPDPVKTSPQGPRSSTKKVAKVRKPLETLGSQ
jgi:hypothetical protein